MLMIRCSKTKSYPYNRLHLSKSHRLKGKNSKVENLGQKQTVDEDEFMENIPFLGLAEEIALGKGPNSDDAIAHDTQRRVGALEITVLTSKFIPLNVQCLSFSTHLLIPGDYFSFKSTFHTISFSGIRYLKNKVLSWRTRCTKGPLLSYSRIQCSGSFGMWHILFQKGKKEVKIL